MPGDTLWPLTSKKGPMHAVRHYFVLNEVAFKCTMESEAVFGRLYAPLFFGASDRLCFSLLDELLRMDTVYGSEKPFLFFSTPSIIFSGPIGGDRSFPVALRRLLCIRIA
jgi:hypothetical protein